MTYKELSGQIAAKGTMLCVGLDTDTAKIPETLKKTSDPIFEFNKEIIDATAPYCIAYKPNIAFYEAEGIAGWKALEKTVKYIRQNHPECFIIADAKRGDIGNTADRYAKAFFGTMDFDAVTLAPYMGADSIRPFLKYEGKWAVVLGLTSNKSAEDFEMSEIIEGDRRTPLYRRIIERTASFVEAEFGDSKERLMFVIGATRPQMLGEIRSFCPWHFFLVPGVGAQGGTMEEVVKYGIAADGGNTPTGMLVNSSRGILYASSGADFAEAAAKAAIALKL